MPMLPQLIERRSPTELGVVRGHAMVLRAAM
jgi:hypothetical protein